MFGRFQTILGSFFDIIIAIARLNLCLSIVLVMITVFRLLGIISLGALLTGQLTNLTIFTFHNQRLGVFDKPFGWGLWRIHCYHPVGVILWEKILFSAGVEPLDEIFIHIAEFVLSFARPQAIVLVGLKNILANWTHVVFFHACLLLIEISKN